MRTDDFDFDLPRELIAQHPASPRDAARMLVVGDTLHDRRVRDLADALRPGDILVCNDTRVIPSRLWGRRVSASGPGARIEATLHRDLGAGVWKAFARPARKLKPDSRVVFGHDLEAVVTGKGDDGEVTFDFGCDSATLLAALERCGTMPLPPYIHREPADDGDRGGRQNDDRDDYQTIFAERPGAVAAPTAGLHFTPALLDSLARRGVTRTTVTLHVGAGTFLPVKTERVEDHRMHAEWAEVSTETADAIAATRAAGGRVVAVGTTSLRTLESAADTTGRVRPWRGETDIFIYPGYRFKAVDLLLTNFHLPRSTLFMLVAAFAGLPRMQAAYAHAKDSGYRFYSYGDACLLERAA